MSCRRRLRRRRRRTWGWRAPRAAVGCRLDRSTDQPTDGRVTKCGWCHRLRECQLCQVPTGCPRVPCYVPALAAPRRCSASARPAASTSSPPAQCTPANALGHSTERDRPLAWLSEGAGGDREDEGEGGGVDDDDDDDDEQAEMIFRVGPRTQVMGSEGAREGARPHVRYVSLGVGR